jgi:hypothetical protein
MKHAFSVPRAGKEEEGLELEIKGLVTPCLTATGQKSSSPHVSQRRGEPDICKPWSLSV